MAKAAKTFLFVGTYTESLPHVQATAKGIYGYERNARTGRLEYIDWFQAPPNPSFLAIHPDRDLVFSVSEVDDSGDFPGGAVASFALDPATGRLTQLDRHSSLGDWPCHITLDAQGRHALLANYQSGSVGVVSFDASGKFLEGAMQVQHVGSSVNPERQEGPHAHSVNLDASGQYVIAADLGMDQAKIYRYDTAQGALAEHSVLTVAPGSGPRHFDFHPNRRWAYLLNEILATIDVCHWNAEAGTLESVQTIDTLPADWEGHVSTADIHVHPNGRWVYNSNRGHDSITMYAIDPATGRLTLLGHESTQGRTPRNFTLDPEGAFLYAANQDSGTVVVFRIDPDTGRLEATSEVVEVPNPVCLKFCLR